MSEQHIAKAEIERCPSCQGRGRWQEQKYLADGTTELVWKYCNDCNGKGTIDNSADDFDMALNDEGDED